jgi:hypothetical protein
VSSEATCARHDPRDLKAVDETGTDWHPAVHWIISNPTYVGKFRWRDKIFEGVPPPGG